MSDYYEPPGKEVRESDDGVKYIEVQEEVGTALIDEYDFEKYEESGDKSNDNEGTEE